jgi:prolyl-tRNA synthetase
VKFADADLIGLPLRVTVSARTLAEDAVELKRRTGGEPWRIQRQQLMTSDARAIEAWIGGAAES